MQFFSPTQVNMLNFKVNTLDNTSGVHTGASQYIDLLLSYKRNSAMGEVSGDVSPVNLPISSVMDPDFMDAAAGKNSAM